MDTGTPSVEPEETTAQEEVIILVDHGGIRVLRERLRTTIEPIRIREHARAGGGKVIYAALYTDRSCLPVEPRLQEAELQEWRNAGFKPIPCPRQPQTEEPRRHRRSKLSSGPESKGPATTKETIDFHLIEGAHELARMNADKSVPVRFVLVIGDGDYVPLSRTLHEQGFLVSVFLTSQCAFLDPAKTPHVEDRLILYEQNGKDTRNKLGSTVDRVLGVRRDHYNPDKKQQIALFKLSPATFTCHECGEKVKFGLMLAHPCNPAHVHLMVNPNPEAGVVQPGFPTEDLIKKTADWTRGLGPKRFLQWYLAQMQVGTGPWFMEALLKDMHTIPWDVIDIARLVSQIGGTETMTVDEAMAHFSEDALKIASELKILDVTEGEELAVTQGLYEHLEPLLNETRDRLCFRHISRVASEPNEGALTYDEIRRRVFGRSVDPALAAEAEDIPREGIPAIMEALKTKLSQNGLIYWLTDRSRVDRTADERGAVKRIVKHVPEYVIAKWISVLIYIESELDRSYSGLEIADKIAEWAGDQMTLEAMKILLENGVLRHYGDSTDRYSRGSPSHSAFNFLRSKRDTMPSRAAS